MKKFKLQNQQGGFLEIIIAIIIPRKNKPNKKTITKIKGSKTEIKILQNGGFFFGDL